jgi:hypothetical protein
LRSKTVMQLTTGKKIHWVPSALFMYFYAA